MKITTALAFALLLLIKAYVVKAQGQIAAGLATGVLQGGHPAIGGGGYQPGPGKDWNAGGLVGVGSKVWESQNGKHSVGVAGVYSQAAGRTGGVGWKTKPNIGVGLGYQYKWGRK